MLGTHQPQHLPLPQYYLVYNLNMHMPYILIIDTALDHATVCICSMHKVIATATHTTQQQHAMWLHTTIHSLLNANHIAIQELSTIAVTAGPGSYTGVRIGLTAAKGLCYALGVPLITISTLQAIALSNHTTLAVTYLPTIDARRQDVYTTTLQADYTTLIPPHATSIEADYIAHAMQQPHTIICGTGIAKLVAHYPTYQATIGYNMYEATQLYALAIQAYNLAKYTDVMLATPLYAKEFYDTRQKPMMDK